jgi:uracil-DNA glycosylase
MAKKTACKAQPPKTKVLSRVEAAAKVCTACHLYKNATQTVFGDGSKKATLMLVGEQPGNQEDLKGEPFVGPSGALLDELFERIGIPRDQVYITNAVKHFKWKPQGKIRLHQKPNATEMQACRPWLEAEVAIVQPKVIVCLGVTAASSVFGKPMTLGASRKKVFRDQALAPAILVSWHPSSILRAPNPEDRHDKTEDLFADLRKAWKLVKN